MERLERRFLRRYAKYIDGYSVVDGRNQQFYAGPPNHDPECGVYSSSKVDMHVTEPNFFNHGGTFEWTMQSGSEKVQYFNPTNHSIAHFEVRPQASAGWSPRWYGCLGIVGPHRQHPCALPPPQPR